MTPEQRTEFEKLMERYKAAKEYEKTKYLDDTPQGKEWAEKSIKEIVQRLGKLWDLLGKDEKEKYKNYF